MQYIKVESKRFKICIADLYSTFASLTISPIKLKRLDGLIWKTDEFITLFQKLIPRSNIHDSKIRFT